MRRCSAVACRVSFARATWTSQIGIAQVCLTVSQHVMVFGMLQMRVNEPATELLLISMRRRSSKLCVATWSLCVRLSCAGW